MRRTNSQVALDPLQKCDLNRLHQWFNAPHLKPYYMQEPISSDAVSRKFTPRIGGKGNCYCLIASINDVQFGYIQYYQNRSVPDYGVGTIGEKDGVSFDYFIGDVEYLGKGLGSAMLKKTVDLIAEKLASKDRIFFMGHEPENIAAIKCSKRAGFRRHANKEFIENSKIYHLYSLDIRSE